MGEHRLEPEHVTSEQYETTFGWRWHAFHSVLITAATITAAIIAEGPGIIPVAAGAVMLVLQWTLGRQGLSRTTRQLNAEPVTPKGRWPYLIGMSAAFLCVCASSTGGALFLLPLVPQFFALSAPLTASMITVLMTLTAGITILVHGAEGSAGTFLLILIAGVISVAVGIWIAGILSHARRQTITIDRLEERETQILETAHLQGAAQERLEMSREIHDGFTQHVTASLMQMRRTENLLDAGDHAAAHEHLRLAMAHTEQAIAESRFLLAQESLDTDSLTVTELVERIAGLYSSIAEARTSVTVIGETREVQPALQRGLQRILTEALSNALQHADAHQLDITVEHSDTSTDERHGRQLRLVIADDGRGFDPTSLADDPGRGYGLSGIVARAEDLGGSSHIDSSPGHGTRIEVHLPMSCPHSARPDDGPADIPTDAPASPTENLTR